MSNTPNTKPVVIVGAGQGAAQACASLRQFGYDGGITVLGDEIHLPYQRPPLSKAYMKGELQEERLFFKPSSWYEEQGISLKLSTRVDSIDRSAKTVTTKIGETFEYSALIISTGARPRALPIPGAHLTGVFDLRSLDDVARIRPQMIAGKKLVIIGAGYIGLEAAAVASSLGLQVTVLEMAERVLARVAGPEISAYYEALHARHGVEIITSAKVVEIEGEGLASGVRLLDGKVIEADLVLAGIGIVPNSEMAEEAGIVCSNGIVTDRETRTSDPSVFAVGDCARRPLLLSNREGRLESVHNAIEQAKIAAATIVGVEGPAEDCPWFWSDQYNIKLQIAGLSEGYDEQIVRGNPDIDKFSVFYLRDGKLIAVDAVNSPPEFIVSKKLILAGVTPDRQDLLNVSLSMKEIGAKYL